MKRYNILGLLVISLLWVGCFKDDDAPKQEFMDLGVVSGTTLDNMLITTDTKLVLKPIEIQTNDFDIAEGKRVLVTYSVLDKKGAEGYDLAVSVADIGEIYTRPILHVDSQAIRDTLAYDLVRIQNVWVGQDFLNVDFEFYKGVGITHDFYVSLDPEKQLPDSKTIVLDFHHNEHNDAGSHLLRTLMSIPIQELQRETGKLDSLTLKFVSETQWNTYTKSVEYKYGPDTLATE